MNNQNGTSNAVDLEDLVASTDTGNRVLVGFVAKLLAGLALAWSLFQLYYASNLPFTISNITGLQVVFNSDNARAVHLAFAFVLAALSYPLFKSSPRDRVPWYDWILAFLGVISCCYLILFEYEIAQRAGLPTEVDLLISTLGIFSVLICTYRALGLPLVIIALVFLTYVFFGHQAFIPEVIQWKGGSYGKAMWHFWMQTEGVFGVALSVSTSMVFLFVLFGSLLDKAGAGNYLIKVSFALLGHLRGGPAKAAVISSAMTGLISGSSIANVVTTGTFTIPLMKRVGFSGNKAGAVEVASSVNGQIMPPVMGAAAFLMVEYVGVTYLEVVRHAILPALISYIALLYIVHLEALKADMTALPKPGGPRSMLETVIGLLTGFLSIAIPAAMVYYSLGWTKRVFGEFTFYAVCILFLVAYIVLLIVAARLPELEMDDPNSPVTSLPEIRPTILSGLYFLLPIIVLVWCLMVERLSPGLSAYWATIAMLFILITQHPLKAIFRKSGGLSTGLTRGLSEILEGLIAGARNMIGIAIATGAAGIIVGTISLTGAHQVVGDFIEFLSGGNLMAMLVLVAIFSLVLGMGLPTTANYIVVSSLMSSVLLKVAAQNGLIVPPIAVHLFIFYFGIMADVTPPVGLASFAAAAISGSNPINTGFTAFYYSLRTVALPFLFIFNTDLLLIDVTSVEAVFVFIVATGAMLLFAAGTQGYFFAKNRLWEAIALLLVAFTLFRPGFWLDLIEDPFEKIEPVHIVEIANKIPENSDLRLVIKGPKLDGSDSAAYTTIVVPLGADAGGEDRLKNAGILVRIEDGIVKLDEPLQFGNSSNITSRNLSDFDFYDKDNPVHICEIHVKASRIPKEIFYIPALLLLWLVISLQRRRTKLLAF
ncbi:TRAP transporter, 4TM/12TM fusion family protein [Candidatus Endolissoclinum faulkneri L2]|uniref:TRAP transporter, 4TM/12TM fusion family protein n=1 Tax=Candidatus Endolissoclinum faulkneri L2 TaxID=1193729 RepID=K7Z4M5_9PROT|nr:TRAP transporter permease [Candidatus Endolissoclinum faulkneri]AFX98943.1 TRAP transporter, 4TM/12TM fusion family protein [Candidatus Endolissoclinum faulkneri L2]